MGSKRYERTAGDLTARFAGSVSDLLELKEIPRRKKLKQFIRRKK